MTTATSVNAGTILLGKFIRDLLNYDEQLIRLGRLNFERDDFKLNYISPDEIASSPIALPKSFDPTAESIEYAVTFQGQYTIDFYGDDGYSNSVRFQALTNSQKGYELQRDSGLTVFSVTTSTDLKQLTGVQYSPRYQLALNLRYTETIDVPTLRIDTAETSIITD